MLIKKGEYTVGARDAKSGIVGNRAADNILSISKKGIRIHGEEGAVLRGMLLLEASSIITPLYATLQPHSAATTLVVYLNVFLPLLRT